MIKEIEFDNFRNLNGKYIFSNTFNVITGSNNSGKTNILDGIKIAFSSITSDYVKIRKSDFKDSDDSLLISIKVLLQYNSIPTLNCKDDKGNDLCGFIVYIKKTSSGRYVRELRLINKSNFDVEILHEDPKIPNICSVPLIRMEDLHSNGLTTSVSNFIEKEEDYKKLKEQSKKALRDTMDERIVEFQNFCKKFGQELDIYFSDPSLKEEKAYVIEGDKEHNFCIGSGYKSVANIILSTLNNKYNIVLVDEIENHLHPSMIRTLLNELKCLDRCFFICTTHSPVVVNELHPANLLDVKGTPFSKVGDDNIKKLETFMHPGRAEIVFGENIVLVEGYSEEMLLCNYVKQNKKNWTIVNVNGVMFYPYIALSKLLSKKIVVVSDNDIVLSDTLEKSDRFKKLEEYCRTNECKLIETFNTLESDLYKNGFLTVATSMIKAHDTHQNIYVSKQNRKTDIANCLIENNIDLSNWHVIEEINNEFSSY